MDVGAVHPYCGQPSCCSWFAKEVADASMLAAHCSSLEASNSPQLKSLGNSSAWLRVFFLENHLCENQEEKRQGKPDCKLSSVA